MTTITTTAAIREAYADLDDYREDMRLAAVEEEVMRLRGDSDAVDFFHSAALDWGYRVAVRQLPESHPLREEFEEWTGPYGILWEEEAGWDA